MGSFVHVALHGPSIVAAPRPATSGKPTDTPSVEAYRAAPSGATAPGIVLIHDAWGLDAAVRDLADMLAGAGYLVLAPDLAAGWRPNDLPAAEELATSIDPADAALVLAATVDALRAEAASGGARMAVVGLGMGAPLAAFLATIRPDIGAAVIAGPGPDLPEEAWERTEAAFLIMPPAEDEEAVADAAAWADRLRVLGHEVAVVAAPMPDAADAAGAADAPAAADVALEAALPGALAFLVRHL